MNSIKKPLDLAEDVHGSLAELVFTETNLTKEKLDEITKYYFDTYKLSGISQSSGLIPIGINYCGKNKEFYNSIREPEFQHKIIDPLTQLLLYIPEWDNHKDYLEELFQEVNSYLNPEQ